MTKADLGLPSAIKDSTYQQNREIQMPAIAFMSKSELRKTIEWMHIDKIKQDKKIERLQGEVMRLNSKLLQRQEEMISSYRDSTVLKVAI